MAKPKLTAAQRRQRVAQVTNKVMLLCEDLDGVELFEVLCYVQSECASSPMSSNELAEALHGCSDVIKKLSDRLAKLSDKPRQLKRAA